MARLKRTEFSTAVAELAKERGIEPEIVIDSIEEAILAAFVRDAKNEGNYHEEWDYQVELNDITGGAKIFATPPEEKKRDVTPPGFGRIATQTAKQVILQKVRQAEKSAIIDSYRDRVGTVVRGKVLRRNVRRVVVNIGRTHGILPHREQIKNEDYEVGEEMDFYIKEIQEEEDEGGEIILSRTDPGMVGALLDREVPEVNNDAVEIRAVARDPGRRTKVAVYSARRGVDPVGACVGQKGVRIAEVIKALGGEKVDVIQYSNSPQQFIAAALLPAEGLEIEIDKEDKVATVTADEDQLSLAIGKEGQNVKLATRLTGYEIDIESREEEQEERQEAKEEETEEADKETEEK